MRQKKLHVLIVEDLPSDAELAKREVKTVLTNSIFEVVDTEENYVKALNTFKPDIIVSDYQMPKFSGMSALKIRQAKYPFIPFVLLTGSMNEDKAVEVMKAGADDYVIKEHIKRLGPAVLGAIEKKKTELDRNQARIAAIKREKLNRAITETAADAIITIDADGEIIGFNRAAENIFGYSSNEILNNKLTVIIPTRQRKDHKAGLQRLKDGGKERMIGRTIEITALHKNNNEFPIEFSLSSWESDDKKYYTAIIRDITERKQAAENLKISEERLKILFESAPDAYYLSDLKGNFIDGNKAAVDLLGYKREELVGKNFLKLKLLSAKEILRASKLLLKNVQGKGTGPDEFILNRKDGSQVPVEILTHPVKIKNKKVVLGIAREITDRKQAEEEKKEHLRNIELLSKTAMQFVEFSQDQDIYTYIGEQLQAFIGNKSYIIVNSVESDENILTTRAIIGMGKVSKKVAGLIGSNPVGMTYDAKDEDLVYLSDGKLHLYEEGLYGISLKAIPKIVSIAIEKLLNIKRVFTIGFTKENKLFGTIVIVLKENAGELKNKQLIETFIKQASIAIQKRQAEEALKENEEKFRSLVDNSPDIIMQLDADGVINYINYEYSNQKPEDIIGKTIYDLMPIDFHEVARSTINKVFETGKSFSFENLGVGNTDKVLWYRNNMAAISKSGKVKAATIIATDITEHKQAEVMQTEFIASISHELRTPLTTIRESLSLLSENLFGELNSDQLGIVNPCMEDVDRLSRILNNLLAISNIEGQKIKLEREVFDFVELAKGAVSSFEHQATSKNIELVFTPNRESINLYIDRDRIIQVLMNLIGNAIKFTKEGTIEIIITEKEEKVECCIKDTGRGIEQKDLGTLFDRLHQVGKIMRTGEKGSGLGLSICKGIVKSHKGEVWVNSTINKGSKFFFSLPKYSTDEIIIENIENEIKKLSGEHIKRSLLLVRLNNFSDIETKFDADTANKVTTLMHQIIQDELAPGEFSFIKEKNDVVLFSDITKQNINVLTSKLEDMLTKSALKIDKNIIADLSHGYSFYPDDGDNADELMQSVSKALLNNKKN